MALTAGAMTLAFAVSACAAPNGSGAGSAASTAGPGPAPQASIDCAAAPEPAVTVFLEGRGEEAPRRQVFEQVTFAGPVPAGSPAGEGGSPPRYAFTGRDGATRRLAYADPSGPLPLEAGRAYDLVVETVMGEPSPGAVVLSDEAGLVLAAASDTRLGGSVLEDGPPGFTVRLVDGGCRSRRVTKCFASRVNAILEVTHEGTTVRLGHGQRARLGGYEVVCHAAEKVEYTSACADAGVLAISWTIRRAR